MLAIGAAGPAAAAVDLSCTEPLPCAASGPPPLWTAQEPPNPVTLTGRVLVGDVPADTGTVVLHRVSPTFTGAVDSVRVERGGVFTMPLAGLSDAATDDVYFASVRYRNVLYVGGAVTTTDDLVGPYVIRAHPTVPAGPGVSLPIRVRNFFAVREGGGSGWSVSDLFELRNDFQATVVASEAGAAWSYALPPGALDVEVGDSDLPPGAASFSGGRLHSSAPIPPGESVYLVRYRIPTDEFTIPLQGVTESMELLIREPAGDLSVTGLMSTDPVTLEDVTYRRFAGREVAPSVVTVGSGTRMLPGGQLPLVAVMLTLALALVGAALAFRSRTRVAATTAGNRRRALVEVARLDERWNAGGIEAEEYDRRRRELLRELGE